MPDRTHVFIDIEQTIAEDIMSGVLMRRNISNIERFLKSTRVAHISVFSFALIDENDKEMWRRIQCDLADILPIQDQQFEVRATQLQFLREFFSLHIEEKEIWNVMSLLKKDLVFKWWVRKAFPAGGRFMLIDDMVADETTVSGKFMFRIVNVNSLTKRDGNEQKD